MTCHNSHSASVVHLPLILSMRAWAWLSSADRTRLSGGCRPWSDPFASNTSCTSMSISCRQRRVCHSSSIRPRSVSCLDWELEVHAWVEKSRWMASARTQLASCSMLASLSVHAKATNPSSDMMTAPSPKQGVALVAQRSPGVKETRPYANQQAKAGVTKKKQASAQDKGSPD
jgi:hypothetical protein